VPRARAIFILVLLTTFSGVIRFSRLSHPCLWYDESMVFWRTCGSYGQLLDCLRTDGFVPLHYSLIWVVTRVLRPTPFVLRLVPTLCGTLMVPAVYFFGRQLLQRGTSLLAAAFTACSAFMLFYSRDAKMYMDAWLFVTLNIACLLWWFRTGKSTAWLCWIASGAAACGLQISSAIPVAISSLLLLTQCRVRWQGVLMWTAGVLVILSGPVGYYEKFNLWKDRADQNWNESGLQWIGAYNYGRTGPQLLRVLGTTTLMGWEWPKEADIRSIPEPRVNWPARGAYVVLGMLVLACLPWPRRWRKRKVPSSTQEPESAHLLIDPALGRTSEPAFPDDDVGPEPQWRIALWLSLLIVVPVYSFYCRSMPGFASPRGVSQSIIQKVPALLLPLEYPSLWIFISAIPIAIIVFAIRFPQIRGTVRRGFAMIAVIATVLALCQAIAIAASIASRTATDAGKPWESLWVPRYIGFIWPALAVAVAALIMRLPTVPVRIIAICFLLGLNLGIASFRIFGQTEPPVDLMAADAFFAENPDHHTLAWWNLKPGMQSPGSGNLFSGPGEYYLDLLRNKPVTPTEFKQSIRLLNNQGEWFPVPWYRALPPDLDRIIVWNQYQMHPMYTTQDPPPPAGWKLVSDQWFVARDCWIWQDLARYRRREYQHLHPVVRYPESPTSRSPDFKNRNPASLNIPEKQQSAK
jgi:hypothetical protein